MTIKQTILSAAFFTLAATSVQLCLASAPQPSAAADYDRLRMATTLDAPGKTPFHIKIEFQLFDLAGKATSNGTVEEWWAPEVGSRTVITSPTFSETEPLPEGAPMPTASRDGSLVHELLKQFVHPLADRSKIKDIKYSEESRKFGQTSLTCIGIGYGPQDDPDDRYCFDPATEDLRLEMQSVAFKVARNHSGKFRDSSIDLDLSVAYGANDCIHGHIAVLEGIDASAVGLNAGAGIASLVSPGKRIGGKDIHTTTSDTGKSYSCAAFEFVIGKDGKVSSVAIIYSSDQALTDAVKAAVSTWTYAPALRNGNPVEVRSEGGFEVRGHSF